MCSFGPIQFLNNFWRWSSFCESIGLDCRMRRWGFTSWSFPKMDVKKSFNPNQKDIRVRNSGTLIWVLRQSFFQANFSTIYLALHLSNVLPMHEAGAYHCQSAGLHFLAALQGSQQEFSKIWLLSIWLALAWGRLVGFQLLLSHSALKSGLGGRGFGEQWSWVGKSGRDLMGERRRM